MDERSRFVTDLEQLLNQAEELHYGFPLSMSFIDQKGTLFFIRLLNSGQECPTSTMPDVTPTYPLFYLCTNERELAFSGRISKEEISFQDLPQLLSEKGSIVERFAALESYVTPDSIDRLKRLPYEEFLRTSYWRTVSGYMKERDKACQRCKEKVGLQVHHRHYSHRGEEFRHLEDLVVLCELCHLEKHGYLDIYEGEGAVSGN